MNRGIARVMGLILILSVFAISSVCTSAQGPRLNSCVSGLHAIDIRLPSLSTGSPTGTLAVRIHAPAHGKARYPEGAPVLIWGPGGYEVKGINHDLPANVDDIIIITYIFPGGEDIWSGLQSDGVYDQRGMNCIQALRDVILYAAGELTDDQGRTIDDIVPVTVLHDNIGLEGISNGGNIIVAVAALYGEDLIGHLRYIVQWETPVSSQVATRDLGRVWLEPPYPTQGDFFNLRYLGYGKMTLDVNYSDLSYDQTGQLRRVFHDGNGDGIYTTIEDPITHLQTPDLNLNAILELGEDFPLDTYPHPNGAKEVYSRAVTRALAENSIVTGTWPPDIATLAEANAFWDIREAVHLYSHATTKIPDLEAMVLAGVQDHVQSAPTKPHIRQAFEGWLDNGAWVQINPSPGYLIEACPALAGRTDLPNRVANMPPADWRNTEAYCIPENIHKTSYQLAAVWQMADRAQGVLSPTPTGGELITYVDSEGERIAVRVEVPLKPRYAEGAPVVVEVSTWFVPPFIEFHRVNETTQIGAICVSYLWPGGRDIESGARSEGVYDFGGPDSLAALRDVIKFASGLIPDIDGYFIDELVEVTALTDNVGLWASSHAGVMGTNVLVHHGAELPRVKYLIGRENPTRDEMYPLELGYFDDQRNPIYNPFYSPEVYSPTTVTIDYSTVGWYQQDQFPRPYHAAGNGNPEHTLHETISPKLWGNKRYYSRAMTHALLDNGALTLGNWPGDLATPAETDAAWGESDATGHFRITVPNYPNFITQAPDLKVMLVFAEEDHVQAALSKPHIHQAYDGFHQAAGLWVRMNPDRAYVEQVKNTAPFGVYPDNDANTEPSDWFDVALWGFPNDHWSRQIVWLAAVAEMADRVQANNWAANLSQALFEYSPEEPPTPLVVLRLPHDVDRLSSGNTLITDGGRLAIGSLEPGISAFETSQQVIEVDGSGDLVWRYARGLEFAHNADRLGGDRTLTSDTGHDRVIEIDASGTVIWTTETVLLSDGSVLSYPNDANWLIGDHVLITDRDNHRVIEIDRAGTIVWQFGETGLPGSDGTHLNGPHNADRLANGNTIIADSNNRRIIEVMPNGSIAWEYKPLGADALNWPRDADRLVNGNTLIIDSRNGRIIEVTMAKQIIWWYGGMDLPYDADRLVNGNTLISDSRNSRVIEVDSAGLIVWEYPPSQAAPSRKFLPIITK